MRIAQFLAIIVWGNAISAQAPSLSKDVTDLSDRFFKWRVSSLPQFATFVGISDYDTLMDDLTEAGYASRLEDAKKFFREASDLRQTKTEHVDQLNLDVLIDGLQMYIDGSKYNMQYMAISSIEGPHADYPNLLEWMPKDSLKGYHNMTTRLSGMAKQIDEIIQVLKKGVELGITLHNISLVGLDEALKPFSSEDPGSSPLFQYFIGKLPDSVSQEEIEALREKAKKILSNEVAPAFQRLRDYLSKDYVTRSDISISSVPKGPELYQELIKFHTSTNLTAKEIQKLGYEQVEAIEQKMMKIIKDLGHDNMTVQEFSSKIREDPSNFYNTPEELVAGFEKLTYDVIPSRLPRLFSNIPQAELKVLPGLSENSPVAYYLSGAYDGSRPGVFYVNNHSPKSTPKYDMMSLSLHEGNPGHHLQGSHALESDIMPYFRRVVDDRNYNLSPSKFPMYTSYLEGWALYSETLGFDLNLYDDPLDRYGHYSQEIFRACRLVVDTGMHALGMTREEAIDYMFKHTASTRHELENEIDRYITWPGQALAYKIGEIKFRELRRKAETELGNSFNIKDFHQVVLDSFGPMYLVEQEVERWIEMKLQMK